MIMILSIVLASAIGGVHVFFQRLKDLREDKDWTQTQIGKLLGIQQTVYSRYERGFQPLPVEHLLKLAIFYETSTDYILGRTNIKDPYPRDRAK